MKAKEDRSFINALKMKIENGIPLALMYEYMYNVLKCFNSLVQSTVGTLTNFYLILEMNLVMTLW